MEHVGDISCCPCREDIWQLEDKVRAAKWATSPTEQVRAGPELVLGLQGAA